MKTGRKTARFIAKTSMLDRLRARGWPLWVSFDMALMLDKYGGVATVHAVVEKFYDRVLDEDSLADFFTNTDMEALVAHQTKFISSLMGGPGQVSDRHLRDAHQPLGISDADFSLIAQILQETLADSGVAEDDVAELMGLVAAKKDLIVV